MKTAIIIGATSGLGRGVAELLVAKGWKVGIAGRRVERLETMCSELGAEKVVYSAMDVTSETAVEALDSLIASLGGAPDMLLYCSGIGHQNRALDETWEIKTVRTNCEGMVRVVDHFVNHVRNNRELYSGIRAHIGVITSVAGTEGMGTCPSYSATKKMMSTYVTALAQLVRMEKIPVTFTDIRPGFVATEILDPTKNYPMVMSKDKAARLIVRALEKRKRVFIFDWRFRLMVAWWRTIPRFLWERMTWFTN